MQLYNSLSRKKEEFTPVTPGKVSLYSCGITAYDLSHIGHARSAVVFDILVRYLRSLGYDVTFIRNFTDIEDKIINRANKEGVPWQQVVDTYITAFHDDMDILGVQRATHEPKATDHIGDMIALIEKLIKKDHAYATPEGDVYFRVRSFKDYGKLSGRSVDELEAGARVAPDETKEDPLDFALWKAAKPGEPFWESPWSKGRPGWHIECSAMSEKYAPLPLDIHGGGQDLIFPHHENEIAQSEAAIDGPFCRFWVHNGFVQVNSEKMSKSLGNFRTIRDILASYLPETLRFFLITRHYHSPIDFTFDAMDEAEKNLRRIYETLVLTKEELSREKWVAFPLKNAFATEFDAVEKAWTAAMDDDLNTAAAMGHVNTLIHLINRLTEDKNGRKTESAKILYTRFCEAMARWGAILGLFQRDPAAFLDELKQCRAKRIALDVAKVEDLMLQRQEARKNKEYAKSDALRDELTALGVSVRDTPQGATWDIA
ncbi:Cysteine--tRNA ligase [uncultured delta proteobacterium]|uniref:Cysteine--tRNA ligase n=1 Tax=uncultured delta proteobacterium TaxID=34034 RepID=A0A212J5C8_9DELT|nr:Cysteine--tRNA ligase [uncultured delta proteobacterium]